MADLTLVDMAACASAGGLLSSLLTTPLDVLKVRQQTSAAIRLSPITQAVAIVRNEGITTLWSGLRPALGITVPATMIYMSAYEKLREHITAAGAAPQWASPAVPLVAGGIARTMSGIATAPMELMRTRAQASHAQHSSMLMLARQQGPATLWRGVSASLARDVPFSCLYWALYEGLKVRLGLEPTPASSMLAAGVAAAVAAVPTTPLDVVKTRTQVFEAQALTFGQVLHELYRHEGPRALFAGVVPRVAKVAPSCAIIVGAYEMGKAQVARYRRRA